MWGYIYFETHWKGFLKMFLKIILIFVCFVEVYSIQCYSTAGNVSVTDAAAEGTKIDCAAGITTCSKQTVFELNSQTKSQVFRGCRLTQCAVSFFRILKQSFIIRPVYFSTMCF